MQRKSIAVRALSALAVLALVVSPALAQKGNAKKDKDKPAQQQSASNDAPSTKKDIPLVPDGMKWGMVRGDIEKIVDKFIDDDFRPKYKAAGKSGPKIKDLDVEVANQKAAFRRSFIDLVPGPTGLDANPIANEFTKGNGEAVMSHHRGPGVKIWFFYIGGRLWKTIEEVSLIDGGLYGKDIGEALKKLLDGVGGTLPREIKANPDKGQFYDVLDWQDGPTHMRIWDRNGVLVIVREEKATVANLPSLRKNSQQSGDKVDPSVAGIMRDAPPPPKDDKKDEPKDKGKGKGKKLAAMRALRWAGLGLAVTLACGCGDKKKGLAEAAGGAAGAFGATAISAGAAGAAGASAPVASAEPPSSAEPSPTAKGPAPLVCPEGMLAIPGADGVGKYCIDRWEASLVDKASGLPLSPYYPPRAKLAQRLSEQWERDRLTMGGPRAQSMPVPPLPAHQRGADPEPMAVSKPGVVPNGYLSGIDAERACKNAGKRLCKHDEWLQACQGQQKRQFPYGDTYRQGACNIFRPKHPAAELHDDASMGHLDPRLNLVTDGGDPLLRKTGATASCASEWGEQALYDMNGNLDEWVDDPKGRFVGGFFSRSKKDGCLSSVSAHPRDYFDYSTGVRCCLSPE